MNFELMPPQSPKSLGAFGMGIAVGFGAGIAMKIFLPGVTSLAEAILNKLGFELGDLFLSAWNPEERAAAPLQLKAMRRAPQEKPRRKLTITAPAAKSRKPVAKKSSAPIAPKGQRTPKTARSSKPTVSFSSKRIRSLSPLKVKLGVN